MSAFILSRIKRMRSIMRLKSLFIIGGKPAWVMSALVLILSLMAPLAILRMIAEGQGVKSQISRAELVTGEIVRKGEAAAEQIRSSNLAIKLDGSVAPCSKASLENMRNIALASNQVAGVGFISGNRLMCSSMGLHGAGIPVGEPTYLGPNNTAVRTSVELPFTKDVKFLVLTDVESGASTILHTNLAIDVFTNIPGISMGLFSYSTKQPIDNRGSFNPQWEGKLEGRNKVQWEEGQNVVALERSTKFDLVAFTAIPKVGSMAERSDTTMKLLPISIIVSVLMAVVLLKVMRHQTSLPAMLRNGLRRNELSMVYQPLVDLSTGKWVGVEALVRWHREDGTSITPDVFIPMAEESGLIGKVTDRVLELVSRECVALVHANPNFHVGINLSATDFASGDIAQKIISGIKRLNLDPACVMVEATEHVFMDIDTARRNLEELRKGGVKVAIDDFGTGYSSLSYLTTLQVDFIKIDKAFVETIGTEAATSSVVNHIIMMANSLNISLIAEGVETEQQAEYLRERGVHFAQGWLFSKPLRIAEIESQLTIARAISDVLAEDLA